MRVSDRRRKRSGGEARNVDGRGPDEMRQATTIGVSRDASLVRVAAGELGEKTEAEMREPCAAAYSIAGVGTAKQELSRR